MEYQQQTAEGYSAGFWYPIQWAVVTPLGTLYYRNQDTAVYAPAIWAIRLKVNLLPLTFQFTKQRE